MNFIPNEISNFLCLDTLRRKIKQLSPSVSSTSINPNVAKIQESHEHRSYSIGFRYFDDTMCVLRDVDAKVSRKVHEVYRNFGKYSSLNDIKRSLHDVKRINNSSHYAKYYRKVTEDTEVYEFDAGVCRGFFFFDEPDKIIQMLAIDHHPEDKKNRR